MNIEEVNEEREKAKEILDLSMQAVETCIDRNGFLKLYTELKMFFELRVEIMVVCCEEHITQQ